MRSTTVFVCALSLMTLMLAEGCGSGTEDREPEHDEASGDESAAGISRDGYTLVWEFDEEDITFTMSAPTTGWVAVGFDPSAAMLDADIIIGYVEDGDVFLSDQWGDGYTSHRPDIELGGSDDAALVSGSEGEGVTEISFSRPMSTGDGFDHQLRPGGTHTFLLAYGPGDADGFAGKHSWVTTVEVILE